MPPLPAARRSCARQTIMHRWSAWRSWYAPGSIAKRCGRTVWRRWSPRRSSALRSRKRKTACRLRRFKTPLRRTADPFASPSIPATCAFTSRCWPRMRRPFSTCCAPPSRRPIFRPQPFATLAPLWYARSRKRSKLRCKSAWICSTRHLRVRPTPVFPNSARRHRWRRSLRPTPRLFITRITAAPAC